MPRYAAIDIGSNSIRMQAAEVVPGSPLRILAADREVTRLGESVFRTGRLSEEAIQLAERVLARMAEQYRKLEVVGVRVVATSAVRDTRNQPEFVERAAKAAGAPVEIISGREEARLIHLGVQSRWPHPEARVLILDIGGGSAEIIASESGQMREAVSRPLGAVRLREMFLNHDPPSPRELHQLDEYILEKLAIPLRRISPGGWQRLIGTSATASAVASAIHRVPRSKRDDADRLRASTAQVRQLYRKLIVRDLAGRRKIQGIGPRRAELIIPGAAVLLRVMEQWRLPSYYYSVAGVRDGIIADLAARGVGRELARLDREQRKEVEQMARRYGVELEHARKVAGLAHALFESLQPLHKLPPAFGKLLEAAAYLHDVGHFVSDSNHHRHSYYLVANSDMPGFDSREREFIANLCRYHRKAMPSAEHTNFQSLSGDDKRALVLLAPLLRVADGLDRAHGQRVEGIRCAIRDGQVVIQLVSSEDIDLEQWAAERAGEVFREVYGRPVAVVKAQN